MSGEPVLKYNVNLKCILNQRKDRNINVNLAVVITPISKSNLSIPITYIYNV